MVQYIKGPGTVKSKTFDPETFLEKWSRGELKAPEDNHLKTAILRAFGLPEHDDYVYHAIASVTLNQVQAAVNAGDRNGLHAWYLDDQGKQLSPPPQSDIAAYTSIFSPTTSTRSALSTFSSNAKKSSLRSAIASHLLAHRHVPTALEPPKRKSPPPNPYLDFWTWSCSALQWAGPDAEAAARVQHSHHVLPVFYHHFGCAVPSFEALEAVRKCAGGRRVLDVGSGGGYWTCLLRRLGMQVTPIDSGESVWRTVWVEDTIKAEGARWLKENGNGKEDVLLLVYPQVTGEFTRSVLDAYKGRTVCVAGTQNRNGFTGFKDVVIDEYMAEKMPQFEKILQTPLPSFAGKDEALFVFEKRMQS